MRTRIIYSAAIALFSVMVIAGCRKQAWDDFYGRPDNLESPVYQLLESSGNFTHYLAAVEKAGYKTTLSSAGYWTVFAPHDSAFAVYLQSVGASSVSDLDSLTCQKIVTYSLAYNAFKKERVDDFQSNSGWVPNVAFKRRTAFYTGIYDGNDEQGQPIKVISSNRNNNGSVFWVEADNNNKYLPVFTDTFFISRAISTNDYNYFYPNTQFKGYNIADAVVTQMDLAAENGVVHVVNKVLLPLQSLDEYLATKPEFSDFKAILDKYLVDYVLNPTATQNYKNRTGRSDNIYTKVYNPALAFSLNNENFLKQNDNDGQRDGYTLFVPENAALNEYINDVLLEHYPSVDHLPINVIYDFINAHMFQTAVWPGKFNTTYNVQGEPAKFDAQSNVIDKKMLSNGFFYGTNKVQHANVFSTIYSKVYLDPKYSYMAKLIDQDLRTAITNPNTDYVMFMVDNDAWNEAGYFADQLVDNNPNFQWRYIPKDGGSHVTGSSAVVRMLRLMNQLVVSDPNPNIMTLSGSGVAQSMGGEFIGFNGMDVFTSGSLDSLVTFSAHVSATKTASNGVVHYIDKLPTYTETPVGFHIRKLGLDPASPYNSFWRYLENSTIYNKGTGEIGGIAAGVFYTVFAPSNDAILAAVNAGLLPGTGTAPDKVPNFNPSAELDKQLVAQFLQFHILNKKALGTDGKESGTYETFLKRNNGDPTTLFLSNGTVNAMDITDMENRHGKVIFQESNYLSNRTLIHLIDNYLQYIL